jgi:hypothetical protein
MEDNHSYLKPRLRGFLGGLCDKTILGLIQEIVRCFLADYAVSAPPPAPSSAPAEEPTPSLHGIMRRRTRLIARIESVFLKTAYS